MIIFLLPLLLTLLILLNFFAQKVLPAHHLKILLAWQLLGWEWRIFFLFALALNFFTLNILLLKLGQESLPVFILHFWILR